MSERGRRDGREGRSGRATSSHAIDARLVNARASDPWFDVDVDATATGPFDAERIAAANDFVERDETSHIARRRVSTVDPHELTLSDLIDAIDEEPLPLGSLDREVYDTPTPAPALDSAARLERAASLAPLRIVPSPTPPRVRPRRPRVVLPAPPSRGTLVATAVVAGLATLACMAVVALIVTVRSRAGRIEPRVISPSLAEVAATSAPANATAAPAPPTTPTPPSTAAPAVDIAALPRPTSGTIVGLPSRRIWIDGHLAGEGTASVRCGAHTVQIGSAGTPRDVDVPCGATVRVAP